MAKKMQVCFILDETGSMIGVKQQTISGFNEYLDTLKQEKNSGDIRFTLVQFNSAKTEVVYDGVPLKKVVHINHETYCPTATTPLYDAIGKAIHSLEGNVKSKKKAKVLVIIQTDGQENASKEFAQQSIFSLIDKKKKEGWTFAFLGADQDAWVTSQVLGISKGNTMSYDSKNTHRSFVAISDAVTNYSRSGGSQTDSLFKEDDTPSNSA